MGASCKVSDSDDEGTKMIGHDAEKEEGRVDEKEGARKQERGEEAS